MGKTMTRRMYKFRRNAMHSNANTVTFFTGLKHNSQSKYNRKRRLGPSFKTWATCFKRQWCNSCQATPYQIQLHSGDKGQVSKHELNASNVRMASSMEGMYKFKRNAVHSNASIVTKSMSRFIKATDDSNASQWAKRYETGLITQLPVKVQQ